MRARATSQVAASYAHVVAQRVRPGDALLYAAYFGCNCNRDSPQRLRERVATLAMQLRELQAALAPKGVPLLLTSGTPKLRYSGRECYWESRVAARLQVGVMCVPDCAYSISASRALLQPWMTAFRELAATLQGVHFLDIHDAICDVRSGLCGPVLPGWSAASHRDDHHLSHEGSFSLWPRFRELFQDAGLM